MTRYFHSVKLDSEKCKGCTNCIKQCPVEAIRVYQGRARIIEERCIDCGECIRVCPNHAKVAVTDTLAKLSEYKYTIALPAPSLFGQFREEDDLDNILDAFLSAGFDDVFEVALAAEVVGHMVHEYLNTKEYKRPLISSACPAAMRLMQIKFPDLLEHATPIMSPMEVAARLAKENAVKKTGLPYEDIGAFFISPCPAKMTEVKQPMNVKASSVDGVIGVSYIYKDIVKHLSKNQKSRAKRASLRATGEGMAWGYVTGESRGVRSEATLSVGGIHDVTSALEAVERGELNDIDFIELQACKGGCVGGPLNIQNFLVGRVVLKRLVQKYRTKTAHYQKEDMTHFSDNGRFGATEPLLPRPVMVLDDDVTKALVKMERLDAITKELPGMDCGACGSPSCRALAEDIIRGQAFDTDCIVKLRERVKTLAGEILDLAQKLPPAMSGNKDKPLSDEDLITKA